MSLCGLALGYALWNFLMIDCASTLYSSAVRHPGMWAVTAWRGAGGTAWPNCVVILDDIGDNGIECSGL